MDSIGSLLKKFRTNYSFTQADIAAALKVDKSHISKIESGEDFLTKDVFLGYCKLFGFDSESSTKAAEAIFSFAKITTRDKVVADAVLKVLNKLEEQQGLERKRDIEKSINMIFEKMNGFGDINNNNL